MIPTATIDKLEQCFHALAELGAQLSDAEWETPTDQPGWSVKDNLSHLIGIERMMQGLPATEHRSGERDYIRNPIGANNESEVDARRGTPGADVLKEWNDLVAVRLATLRGADDAYFEQPAMTPPARHACRLPARPHPRLLAARAGHAPRVGRPGNLAGPSAEHTVDRLIRTLPIVIGKRAATPEGAAVAFAIIPGADGGVERHLVYEVREGRAAAVEAPTNSPVAAIALDTEAFVVLATGRRTADTVTAQVSGDAELAGRILGQLNMMI
jgi:uncharacterized protein (TIGR03083 family)